MGPALLPTPLSPMRGHLASDVFPASRSSILAKTRLASSVYDLSRSILQNRAQGPNSVGVPMGAPFRVWLRHRRSHRHPATFPQASTPPPDQRPCSGAPPVFAKPRLSAYPALDLERLSLVCTADLLDREPGSQSFTLPVLRSCLRRSALPRAETSGTASLDKRVDSCQRGFRSTKSFRVSALRLRPGGVLCSEDKLKLRSNPRLDKCGKWHLSTFPRIICGQRWTTQRSAALDAFVRDRRPKSCVCRANSGNFDITKISRL